MKSNLNKLWLAVIGFTWLTLGSVTPVRAESLINGYTHSGTLPVGVTNIWTFSADTGDGIVVRFGEAVSGSSLYPWVRIYGPNGALLGSDWSSAAAEVTTRATNSGTFTVVVANQETYSIGGNGTYRLTLSTTAIGSPVVVAPGDEGGTITNGYTHTGSMPVGDAEVWTFSAAAGDGIVVRFGEAVDASSLYPWVRIYGPNGALLGSDWSSAAAEVTTRATNSGTFTVVVANQETYSIGGNGTYRLTLSTTAIGSPVVVAPGDEGGTITNGYTHTGSMPVGDAEVWTFSAAAGDGIVVRFGEAVDASSLYPWVRIYGPNGALLGSDWSSAAAEVTTRATNSGTFTVVVANQETYSIGGNGTYRLTLSTTAIGSPVVVAPGDEGGTITNGYTHTGSMPVGDAEVWTFSAAAGDGIVVRFGEAVDASSLYPWVRIYGPNGALLGSDWSSAAAEVTTRATNSGTFTVVVANQETYSIGGNGTYRLTLSTTAIGSPVVVAPGDEGGTITNGYTHTGSMPVGDAEVWTFSAAAGDGIVVRFGEAVDASSLYPWVRIYGPNGALLGSDWSSAAAEVTTRATNSGTFTVVVANQETYSIGGNGTYRLTLSTTAIGSPVAVAPGDEGGAMANGFIHVGTIETSDLDVWTFNACAGDVFVLQLAELTGGSGFTPAMRLYAPNGVLTNSVSGSTSAQISQIAPLTGTYTLVVGDDASGAGTYELTGTGVSAGLILCRPLVMGTNVVIRSAGGPANGNYVLHSTTNIALPSNAWTPIHTNQFSAYGEFSVTNQFNPLVRQEFFRVRVP